MHEGFYFRDKAHLLKVIKQNSGVYSIRLPLTDEEIYNDIFYDVTVGTFSTYYPREFVLPADLSKLRVKTATESTSSDISDIYELPNLFPLTLGNEIHSIAKIVPFNDMRYEATTHAYETIESFQALALAQGIANLSSMMEPPMFFQYLGGRRFRLTNCNYYKDRVIITVEIGYNRELFDIPKAMRMAFAALAELDFRRTFYANLSYWNEIQNATGGYRLRVEDWQNAEDQRNELLNSWTETFHEERTGVLIF
jgi:hypothetical protein